MRVLHVLPFISLRAGGPVVFAVQAADAMTQMGVDSTLVATSLARSPTAREWRRVARHELPSEVDRLDVRLFDVGAPRRLAYSAELSRSLARSAASYDLIHIHSLWLFPQYAAHVAAHHGNIPYIVSPHGALDPYLRARGKVRKALATALWQRRMLEDASLIHITTPEEGELIADVAPRVERSIVPVGVWVDRLRAEGDSDAFFERHFDGRHPQVILFLGRLTYKKGVDILIRAFAFVRRTHPTAVLVLVGPDDERLRPYLEAVSREEAVADAVIFTGALYGDERANALAAASVWALSSHTENFGVAVLESLARGLPTVVSPSVNLAAMMREHDAGLVAPLDPEQFGTAIASLLENPTTCSRIGANARALANTFDWAKVAPSVAAMYQNVLDRPTQS